MSYILDALRRADSERERGAVPGLHTLTAPPAPGDAHAPRRAPPWAWLGLGLAGGLALALAWVLLGRDTPPEPLSAAAPQAAPILAPAPPVPPPPLTAPAPTPPPPLAAATPAPVVVPPVAAAPPRPAQHSQTAAPAPSPAPRAAQATAAQSPAPASAADAAPPVVALKDLPDEIRRALPSLALGGSIYSDSAANRFLIVNGQLFHENDALTAELTLRQIKLKSAVLEFRGYRYEISY